MPVISPNAFAPPAANAERGNVPPKLREQVRRLERAHSAQRAGRMSVPTGLASIDALLPEGGLLTGALHEARRAFMAVLDGYSLQDLVADRKRGLLELIESFEKEPPPAEAA